MIARARCKFIKSTDFIFDELELKKIPKGLYFNSGRAALKFILEKLKQNKTKELLVGLQSFNCSVVLDAILESGNKALLYDINKVDFSIDLDILKSSTFTPNVLLLTHYQGIPCLEYKNIVDYCKKNNIVVVEDCAQSVFSSINDIEIGTLGDYVIWSFANDKPFSSLSGGALFCNSNVISFQSLQKSYKILKEPNLKAQMLELKTLRFLFNYSLPKHFNKNVIKTNVIKFLIRLRVSDTLIYSATKGFFLFKAIELFLYLNPILKQKIKITKMGELKKKFLSNQFDRFSFNSDQKITKLEMYLESKGIKKISRKGAKIAWNRYSFICDNYEVFSDLENKIEVMNFNWPFPLHTLYPINNKIVLEGSYPNSEKASKEILNVPIWTKFILYDK